MVQLIQQFSLEIDEQSLKGYTNDLIHFRNDQRAVKIQFNKQNTLDGYIS